MNAVEISEKLGSLDKMISSAKTWIKIEGRTGAIQSIIAANNVFLSEDQKSALLALALVRLAELSND